MVFLERGGICERGIAVGFVAVELFVWERKKTIFKIWLSRSTL